MEREGWREVRSTISRSEDVMAILLLSKESRLNVWVWEQIICLENSVWLECDVSEMNREKNILSVIIRIHILCSDTLENLLVSCR